MLDRPRTAGPVLVGWHPRRTRDHEGMPPTAIPTTLWMFTVTTVLLAAVLVWHRWVNTHPDIATRSRPDTEWLGALSDAPALRHQGSTSVAATNYDLQFSLPALWYRLRARPLSMHLTAHPGTALVLRSSDGDGITLSGLTGFDSVLAEGLAHHHLPVARICRRRPTPNELQVTVRVGQRSYRLRARAVTVRLAGEPGA